ncbi:hypothetical protein PENSPDRAFT_683921 [Peniophora sp. CONT]|nr:hypothetical protein PENSPDRAFT_683921 [Peniophora sp. CONT]
MSAYDTAFVQATQQCAHADNSVTSCFPTNDTSVDQGQYIELVWNSRLPQFVQSGKVDVHIFRDFGAEELGVYEAIGVTNPTDGTAGVVHAKVQDSWFNSPWNGMNMSDPFYFTIAPSGTVPQKTAWFRATQTGPVPLPSDPPTASSTPFPDESTNTNPSVPAGTIAGAVVGGSAALLLIGIGAWLLRRRRRAAARRAITVNLGSDTNSDTHSVVSEFDEKAGMRERV